MPPGLETLLVRDPPSTERIFYRIHALPESRPPLITQLPDCEVEDEINHLMDVVSR